MSGLVMAEITKIIFKQLTISLDKVRRREFKESESQ